MLFKILIKYLISLCGFFIRPLIRKPVEMGDPERIAILLWGGIGNYILFSPALYAIRARFPEAKLAIGSFQHFAEEMFYETVDSFLTIEENPSLRSTKHLLFLLKEFKPDMVISNAMSPTFLSSLIAYLTGARIRVGMDRQCRGCLNNIRVKERREHEVLLNRRIVKSAGIDAERFPLRMDIHKNDEKQGDSSFRKLFTHESITPVIAVQAGSGRGQTFKRWDRKKFVDLVKELIRYDVRVVVIGTEEEKEEINYLDNAIQSDKMKILRKKLSLPQVTVFLKRVSLIIANDTSLVHIGSIIGVPSVVIYGPTDPVKNKPWGVDAWIVRKKMKCSPCYNYRIPQCRLSFQCLRKITVDEVFDAVKTVMARRGIPLRKAKDTQLL
jgi:heptosyltransferase-2